MGERLADDPGGRRVPEADLAVADGRKPTASGGELRLEDLARVLDRPPICWPVATSRSDIGPVILSNPVEDCPGRFGRATIRGESPRARARRPSGLRVYLIRLPFSTLPGRRPRRVRSSRDQSRTSLRALRRRSSSFVLAAMSRTPTVV